MRSRGRYRTVRARRPGLRWSVLAATVVAAALLALAAAAAAPAATAPGAGRALAPRYPLYARMAELIDAAPGSAAAPGGSAEPQPFRLGAGMDRWLTKMAPVIEKQVFTGVSGDSRGCQVTPQGGGQTTPPGRALVPIVRRHPDVAPVTAAGCQVTPSPPRRHVARSEAEDRDARRLVQHAGRR
jgi:hypothetical protein